MYCRNCKKEYPEGSRFCGSCGAPLVKCWISMGKDFMKEIWKHLITFMQILIAGY
ncbi:MAG: zinc-ribbon domain-containing protein [Anaerobutyricum soehngenii]